MEKSHPLHPDFVCVIEQESEKKRETEDVSEIYKLDIHNIVGSMLLWASQCVCFAVCSRCLLYALVVYKRILRTIFVQIICAKALKVNGLFLFKKILTVSRKMLTTDRLALQAWRVFKRTNTLQKFLFSTQVHDYLRKQYDNNWF
jgi:predicted RNase H-like nuclease